MSHDRAVGGLPNQESNSFASGKNYLFAIGISSYEKFDPLPNAVKDIKDFSQLLIEEYSFEQVQLLMDQEATKDNIVDKLNDLRRKIKQEDRLLIYYSGHGYMDGERGFWIPVDAEPDKVSSYVSNADVHDTIKSIKVKHLLLISDSCFSGSLLTRDVSTKMEGAFEEWDKKPSRFVFISGGGPVSDGKAGENSPFATGIINHLRESEDDTINICKLADQVTQEVRYNYKQQAEVSPLFDAGHKGGQFVFVKKLTEAKEWQYALQDDTEGAYVAFMKKYKTGKYHLEAEQKLKDLAHAKEIEEDEARWHIALQKNSAFYYDQYLEKYPDGKYKVEAKAKLDIIEEVHRKEKEEERRIEQMKQFRLAEEKRKKQEDQNQTEPTSKTNATNDNKNKSDANRIEKKSIFSKFLIPILGIGVVIAGVLYWKSQSSNPNSIDSPVRLDTIISTPSANSIVPDSSFDSEGDVFNATDDQKIAGITLINSRTKQTSITDDSGHFKLTQNLNGDTIFALENNDYLASSFIIIDSVKSSVVNLIEKPRQIENKTITGNVQDFKNTIVGAFIKVKRKGKTVKITPEYGVRTNSKGNYSLPHVNEGDELIIEYGYGRKANAIIGRDNIYNLVGNKIVSSPGDQKLKK